MRLIDADELKKCKVYSEERHEYVVAVFNIDNAPTVEPCYQTNSCLDCQMYDKDNHKCPRFCTVIKELVDEERPTGEWIEELPNVYYCSRCRSEPFGDNYYNYCPNCGAKMKGAEE